MFRDLDPMERYAPRTCLKPLCAWLKRLGVPRDEPGDIPNEMLAAEFGFHALDDVACIRIRRRRNDRPSNAGRLR